MSLKWKKNLTVDTFEEFATEFAAFTYNKALSATSDSAKAMKVAVRALCRVFSSRSVFYADSRELLPEDVITICIGFQLKRRLRHRLTNEVFSIYNPPSDDIQNTLVHRACREMEIALPRYAPSFSATKTALVLVLVTVAVVAAITLVWRDPLGWINGKASETASAVTVSRLTDVPDSDNLIDVKLEVVEGVLGSVPVKVSYSGPDASRVKEVFYGSDSSAGAAQAYNCGSLFSVFFADKTDNYYVNLKGVNGLDVTKYISITSTVAKPPVISVLQLKKTGGGKELSAVIAVKSDLSITSVNASDGATVTPDEAGNYAVTASAESGCTITATDSLSNTTTMLLTPEGKGIVAPSLNVSSLMLCHDRDTELPLASLLPSDRDFSFSLDSKAEHIIASIDESGVLTLSPDKDFVGIDSIGLSAVDSYGLSTSAVLPIVVVNNAPYCDSSALHSEITHTPSATGHLFGKLSAVDDEGDEVSFKLVSADYCSVTLAPNGGFLLFLDKAYTGKSASFSFSASDGMLESEVYTYTVSLKNNLVSRKSYTQDVICYSGSDGWYTLNLPQTDSDGDTLDWRVVTPLTNSRTPEGNYVDFASGYSQLRFRVNPSINRSGSETLTLICSDGWLESDEITFKVNYKPNKAPEAGSGNSAVLPESEKTAVLQVRVKNDCPFDRCVIKEVLSAEGGSVESGTGFENMCFTFTMDDGASSAQVRLKVADTLTGESVNVTYKITRR